MNGVLTRLILCGILCSGTLRQVDAEEYRMPDGAELDSYSAETQQFYSAGIAALDRTDYNNAYNQLAKASQLQPGSVRLNRMTAALAVKRGRSTPAEEAKDFYETAISCLRNIMAQPGQEEDFRREVENQLKIAIDEQTNLAQRDVKREALGTLFVQRLNRELAPPTPGPGKKEAGGVSAPGLPAVGGQALSNGVAPGTVSQLYTTPGGPITPGVSTPALPGSLPMPNYPGGMPAPPGAPGQPGLPALPGAAPAPGSPSPEGGAVPI